MFSKPYINIYAFQKCISMFYEKKTLKILLHLMYNLYLGQQSIKIKKILKMEKFQSYAVLKP